MLSAKNKESVLERYRHETESDENKLGFSGLGLSAEQKKLVNSLVRIHGGGVLRRSAKTDELELQIPDPGLLEEDGDKELFSKHLYVNIDKFTRDGHTKAAHCVKNGTVWSIETLLAMLPIEDRAIGVSRSSVSRKLKSVDTMRHFEYDANGNLVPPGPGKCVPLNRLPEDHPAIWYVRHRGFDPGLLVEQFDAAYCEEENPELFYRKLPGGFKASPQGRIVFYIMQFGVRRGWQARQLDCTDGNRGFMMYHPYAKKWVKVAEKSANGKWETVGEYNGLKTGKSPDTLLKQKYIIGPGAEKSGTLMGFDAAIKYNVGKQNPVAGIVEGVLDAARLGPPFCAVMGLTLHANQASLLKNFFHRVYYIPDHDEGDGMKAVKFRASVENALENSGVGIGELELPPNVKDAGDLTPEQAEEIRKNLKS